VQSAATIKILEERALFLFQLPYGTASETCTAEIEMVGYDGD
jgi:hypothetical protein